MEYLATFTININLKCRYIFHSHGSYGMDSNLLREKLLDVVDLFLLRSNDSDLNL